VSFLVAALSSVVGTIILYGLVWLVQYRLLPWVKAHFGGEIDISGIWCAHHVTPKGSIQDLTLELKQRFRDLDGRIIVKKFIRETGATEIKVYAARGYVQHRFVTLSARNTDPHAIGVHVVLLEIVSDARTMRGKGIWYSIRGAVIETSDFEWNRDTRQQMLAVSGR
jgi:hypothetical protein